MNNVFDFLWKKWDSKLYELEKAAQGGQVPNAAQFPKAAAGRQGDESARGRHNNEEVRYLSDIIRQNIGEIKGLHFKLAEQIVEIEHLKRKLEAGEAKRSKREKSLKNGRMRILYAVRKLRLMLRNHKKENIDVKRLYRTEVKKGVLLEDENNFLKSEINNYVSQIKHYLEHIKDLERLVTSKEEQLSQLFLKLKTQETAADSIKKEFDKVNMEKRMMQTKHELHKQEARYHHHRKSAFRRWLSTPLVDMKL